MLFTIVGLVCSLEEQGGRRGKRARSHKAEQEEQVREGEVEGGVLFP